MDVSESQKQQAPMRLITIRASHYCERARWALDLAGLPYVEESSPTVLHLLVTRAARPPGCKTTSTPMLVTHDPDAGTLTDSRDIVAYAVRHAQRAQRVQRAQHAQQPGQQQQQQCNVDVAAALYPSDPELRRQVEEVEAACAEQLGVWTRVMAYQALFSSQKECTAGLCDRVPDWQRAVFSLFYGHITGLISNVLGINASNAAACADKVRALFEQLSQRLDGGTRLYLVGDSFTAADLTFASMAALVLQPEQYGGPPPATVDLGGIRRTMDTGLRAELLATTAAKHALEMYRKHRCVGPSLGASQPGTASAAKDRQARQLVRSNL